MTYRRILLPGGLLLLGLALWWGASPPPSPPSSPPPPAPGAAPQEAPSMDPLDKVRARNRWLRERYPAIVSRSVWPDTSTRPILEKLHTARQLGDFSAVNQAGLDLRPLLSQAHVSDEVLLLSARVQWSYHLFEEGLNTLERVKSRQGVSYLDLAFDLHMEVGHYPEAESALQQRLERYPDVGAWLRLGWWRGVHGDIRGRIEAYTWAIGAADSRDLALNEWLYLHRAAAWAAAGDLTRSRADLKVVRKLGPISPTYHYTEGAISLVQDDLKSAAESYLKGSQIQPQVEMLGVLSQIYARLGLEKQASSQLQLAELVDRNSQTGETSAELAGVWLMAGIKKDQVLSISRTWFSRRKDVGTSVTFAMALIDGGNLMEADRVLQPLRVYGLGGARLLHAEARLAAAKGDTVTVKDQLRGIQQQDPAYYVLNLPALQSLGGAAVSPPAER